MNKNLQFYQLGRLFIKFPKDKKFTRINPDGNIVKRVDMHQKYFDAFEPWEKFAYKNFGDAKTYAATCFQDRRKIYDRST